MARQHQSDYYSVWRFERVSLDGNRQLQTDYHSFYVCWMDIHRRPQTGSCSLLCSLHCAQLFWTTLGDESESGEVVGSLCIAVENGCLVTHCEIVNHKPVVEILPLSQNGDYWAVLRSDVEEALTASPASWEQPRKMRTRMSVTGTTAWVPMSLVTIDTHSNPAYPCYQARPVQYDALLLFSNGGDRDIQRCKDRHRIEVDLLH